MKNLLSIAIVFAAFLMSSDSVYAQADTDQAVIAEAERISGDTFPKKKKTPKGALVYGVNKPSKDVLKAIDKGLKNLFEVANKNGYSIKLNYSDYVVFIAKPDRDKDADGKYSPDIAVNAGQYKDSIYDKGGFIYAAGMVVAYQPCAFLIGEHTKDFNRISDVVRYEGEHLVLYHNDRKRFNETADHSKGGGHPILK
jgi:exopolysaccharide biosynthesis protein